MKRVILAASTKLGRYKVVKQMFEAIANTWRHWANIDVDASDDGVSITYAPAKRSMQAPFTQRVHVRMVPEYHLYNYLNEEVFVTTDINKLSDAVSTIINEDIK